jgi:hypothetical protein
MAEASRDLPVFCSESSGISLVSEAGSGSELSVVFCKDLIDSQKAD